MPHTHRPLAPCVTRASRASHTIALAVVLLLATAQQLIGAQPAAALRYGTGTWEPDSLGNHRAVVHVTAAAPAVFVRIPWRRRDATPELVNAVVIEGRTQQRVRNVARMVVNREFGDLVFEAQAAGDYYVYYLPYTGTFKSNYPKITYRLPEATAAAAWLQANGLGDGAAERGAYRSLPAAQVTGFDAVDAFSQFTAMEYAASASEIATLRAQHPGAPFLAFPESRALSIRMTDAIPRTWAERGAFQPFSGSALRGEYFTFQIGVWAERSAVDSLRYSASAFTRRGSRDVIPASRVNAINLEGIDWSGQRFTRALQVAKGSVQALWFGVDVPRAATPGDYEGRITLASRGAAPRVINVVLRVQPDTAINHGDDAPENLTRLRWLNSQIATDAGIVRPYVPMRLVGNTVSLLGRILNFGADGFPSRIRSFFSANNTRIETSARDVLAAPVRFTVHDASGAVVPFTGAAPRVLQQAAGAVGWETTRTGSGLHLRVHATAEFEGTTEYTVTVSATRRSVLKDIRLDVPIKADAAKYMMGLGQKGGFRPPTFHWTWDVLKKNQDAVWIGDVNAGLQLTLKDEHYVRPLNTNFYLSKPLIEPTSWANHGKGGCDITTESAQALLSCYSGDRVMEAGDSLRFDFRLVMTPFKPLDTEAQWKTRFFHAFVPLDSVQKRGANTINVHHANRINPWINYPFIETAAMRAYIDSAHARGLKTKIYYTVRELTDHAPELFALRSLGDEVLSRGPGGGFSWLQEHLGGDYLAAWHVPAIKDAAVVNSGVSRWHNFYVEGLNWLVQHEKIDGLYLDDVAFDRITMKRVRKVLDRGNPGAILDLHSANQYNPRDGFASSANLYLEHFPFINRLWFGEYFDYDSRPDYWLVEISGIPFGLMGEMLEKGGNPWRGMTMGMTARMPWSGDPAPLWKVWDAFGIQQSQMHGWWSGRDPVTASDTNVLVTTWTKPGSAMLSLGSWRETDADVRLTINWKLLGLDPARTRIRAPAIADFQDGFTVEPNASLRVPGKRGLLLMLEPR